MPRLTMAQALIAFLQQQHVPQDVQTGCRLSPDVLTAVSQGNVLFAIDQQQYEQGYLPMCS